MMAYDVLRLKFYVSTLTLNVEKGQATGYTLLLSTLLITYSQKISCRQNPEPNDRKLFANLQCLYSIFGIRNLTKIRWEIWENAKYLAQGELRI